MIKKDYTDFQVKNFKYVGWLHWPMLKLSPIVYLLAKILIVTKFCQLYFSNLIDPLIFWMFLLLKWWSVQSPNNYKQIWTWIMYSFQRSLISTFLPLHFHSFIFHPISRYPLYEKYPSFPFLVPEIICDVNVLRWWVWHAFAKSYQLDIT